MMMTTAPAIMMIIDDDDDVAMMMATIQMKLKTRFPGLSRAMMKTQMKIWMVSKILIMNRPDLVDIHS